MQKIKKHPGAIEFAVEAKDLDAALAIVKEKAGGNCIIGTKPLPGNMVLVHVAGYTLESGGSADLERVLKEKAHVQRYAEGQAAREEDF